MPTKNEFFAAYAGGSRNANDIATLKDAYDHELTLAANAVYHHQPDAISKGFAFIGWWNSGSATTVEAAGTYTNQWRWNQFVRCVKK
jgi:hypothetical protein